MTLFLREHGSYLCRERKCAVTCTSAHADMDEQYAAYCMVFTFFMGSASCMCDVIPQLECQLPIGYTQGMTDDYLPHTVVLICAPENLLVQA